VNCASTGRSCRRKLLMTRLSGHQRGGSGHASYFRSIDFGQLGLRVVWLRLLFGLQVRDSGPSVTGSRSHIKGNHDHNRQIDHANTIQTVRKIMSLKHRRTSRARSGMTNPFAPNQAQLLKSHLFELRRGRE
jgi:hypothetical protein